MALLLGTNCGFVTTAPTSNPSVGNELTCDTKAISFRDVAPVGVVKITEMGWYVNNATEAANTQVGLYSHDSGPDDPNVRLFTSGDFAKGTSAGWKVKTGLNWTITAGTTYWLAMQLDNTSTPSKIGFETFGTRFASKNSQLALPSNWGSSNILASDRLISIYALVEVEAVGVTRKIKISGTFQDKPIKTKVAGTFEDKPIKIKVGGTFQDA